MDLIKPKSIDTKKNMKTQRIKEYETLEEFVSSDMFAQYKTVLNSMIIECENRILTDRTPEFCNVIYSDRDIMIELRKRLIRFRDKPTSTLKELERSISMLN